MVSKSCMNQVRAVFPWLSILLPWGVFVAWTLAPRRPALDAYMLVVYALAIALSLTFAVAVAFFHQRDGSSASITLAFVALWTFLIAFYGFLLAMHLPPGICGSAGHECCPEIEVVLVLPPALLVTLCVAVSAVLHRSRNGWC